MAEDIDKYFIATVSAMAAHTPRLQHEPKRHWGTSRR